MAEISGIIYCIQNNITGKRYIGQTVRSLDERWRQHINDAFSGKGYSLHDALRKYGIENFIKAVVEKVSADSVSKLNDLLNEREIYWIEKGDTYRNGYNENYGGGGHRLIPAETTEMILKMWKLGYTQEDIGVEADCSGPTVGAILRSLGVTDEGIQKRAKESHPWKARKVAQIDFVTRQIIVHDSMNGAARSISPTAVGSTISVCCSGKTNSAFGCYWRYLEDVDERDLESGYYTGELPETYGHGSGSPATQRKFDYDLAVQLYDQGYTLVDIANIMGCTPPAVTIMLDSKGVSREGRIQRGQLAYACPVVAVDEQGNVIYEYCSIREAARDVCVNHTRILTALATGMRLAGLFWLKKVEGVEKYDPPVDLKLQASISMGCPVIQLDGQGNIIAEYYSISLASKTVGASRSSIRKAIKEGTPCADSYWQHKTCY